MLRRSAAPPEFLELARTIVPTVEVPRLADLERLPAPSAMDAPAELPLDEVTERPRPMWPEEAWPEDVWPPFPPEKAWPEQALEPSWEPQERPEVEEPWIPPAEIPPPGGGGVFTLPDLTLDLSRVMHATPGLVALTGLPIAGLVFNNILFYPGEGEKVAGLALAEVECEKRADLVSPEVCPPRILTLKSTLSPPKRDDSLDVLKKSLMKAIEQVKQEIAAVEKAIADLELRGEAGTAPPNADALLEAYRKNLKALRDTLSKMEEDVARKPRVLVGEDLEEWQRIRTAGQVRLRHKVCLYWRDSSYQLGQSKQVCCSLAFVRVVPLGVMAINPIKVLYIQKGEGEERISEKKWMRLKPPTEKDKWEKAEPFSVEAHEREHVKDYRARLVAYLAGYSFTGFATTKDRFVIVERQICTRLRRILDDFLNWYTYLDTLEYPHGLSEAPAVAAQRQALKDRKDGFERRKQAEEDAWSKEIDALIAAEGNLARCLYTPPPAGRGHCLRTSDRELLSKLERQDFFCGTE